MTHPSGPPGLHSDLPHEVAERVRPPGFEEVLARASGARRRRRTTIGAGLAASLVVGGVAFAVADPGRTDGRSGEPAAPSPAQAWDGSSEADPGLPEEVRALLEADFLDARSVTGSGAGVAAIWHACPDGESCRLVLTTRAGDRTEGRVLGSSTAAGLAPVPGGWLLEEAGQTSRITPSGDAEPLVDVPGTVPDPQAGDTAVPTSRGWRLLRGTTLLPVPTPDGESVTSAYVTASGRLVAATSPPGVGLSVWWTDDGTQWSGAEMTRPTRPVSTAVLAGHGEGVAVVMLGDGVDGSIPVVDVQVSSYAGAPWIRASGLDLDLDGADGMRNLSSLAVSPDGSAFLTTESHGVVRVATDGTATTERLSSHDHSATVLDGKMCLVAEGGRVDHLQCSTDDGETWEAAPLPGFG